MRAHTTMLKSPKSHDRFNSFVCSYFTYCRAWTQLHSLCSLVHVSRSTVLRFVSEMYVPPVKIVGALCMSFDCILSCPSSSSSLQFHCFILYTVHTQKCRQQHQNFSMGWPMNFGSNGSVSDRANWHLHVMSQVWHDAHSYVLEIYVRKVARNYILKATNDVNAHTSTPRYSCRQHVCTSSLSHTRIHTQCVFSCKH